MRYVRSKNILILDDELMKKYENKVITGNNNKKWIMKMMSFILQNAQRQNDNNTCAI